MKDSVRKAVNDQIQAEFQSAYQYLAMSARFEAMGLSGFAAWLKVQWQEETVHAMKLYDHLVRRDAAVELKTIKKPEVSFEKPIDAFEQVLKHEQKVTSLIHELYALAVSEKDYALQTLLHWFIDEQVEEEENARAVIDRLKLIGDSGSELYLFDERMGARPAEAGDGA